MQMYLGRAIGKLKPGAEKRNVISVLKIEFWDTELSRPVFSENICTHSRSRFKKNILILFFQNNLKSISLKSW